MSARFSLKTFVPSGNCGLHGSAQSSSGRFMCLLTSNVAFGTSCSLRRHLSGLHCLWKERSKLKVKAGWFFSGKTGDQDSDAMCERSESANDDILMFFIQLDLATQVQRALNMEQYDAAQEIRNQLTQVDTEIIKQQEAKRGLFSKNEAQDKALSIIRLRADLQNAVEKEDYPLASQLRDQISKLEAESLAAIAKTLVYENTDYAFRLGQKIKHKKFGYQAVICGMDPVCCESSAWMEAAKVEKLTRGANQPFYQILVDMQTNPNILVAYVAEENLDSPKPSEMGRFNHPYVSFLFYGTDTAGDYIPVKQLREKFCKPRYEASGDPPDNHDDDGA